MQRLRIAVVTPEFPSREWPHRGRAIHQTLSALGRHADVHVFCPAPEYPGWLQPRFDNRKMELREPSSQLPVSFFQFPAVPILSRPLNGMICAARLEPLLADFQPDVILNYFLYPAGFAAVRTGRRLGVPVIVGAIGSDLNAIGDPVTRWLTRQTLAQAAAVLVKSRQLRGAALAMGASPQRVHVVSNGCDTTIFHPRERSAHRRMLALPETAELLVFVGRMTRPKGVFELFKAFNGLAARRSQMHLAYIGDGPELARLQEMATASGLSGRIHFPGALTPFEVAGWLAAANVLVLPSYAEGCPNVVIEALNCGRPVVAAGVAGIDELVDESCGILFPPRQSAPLAEALDSALNSEWDEQQIANRFRRSWEQAADEVMVLCEAAHRNALRLEMRLPEIPSA